MSFGLYIAAEGAKAQSRRLEVVSNNLANIDTVGFKPDVAAFQSRFAEAIQRGQSFPGSHALPNVGGGVKVIETLTDFTAGRLERTGNDSDLAIVGEGFFQVEGPGGAPLLTRAGAFAVDADNLLVMAGSNRPVLAAGGGLVQLDPTLPWSVSADGYVQQDGTSTPLALVSPESLDDLEKVGGNLFRSRTEPVDVPAGQREVRQGFLEMSAANSTEQLMEMIATNRAFEATTQLIRHQDGLTGSLVSRVLGG